VSTLCPLWLKDSVNNHKGFKGLHEGAQRLAIMDNWLSASFQASKILQQNGSIKDQTE
jgi:hypothetical protein